jgi:hypothetical protein
MGGQSIKEAGVRLGMKSEVRSQIAELKPVIKTKNQNAKSK